VKERKRKSEREKERDSEKEGEREMQDIFIFNRNDGCLGTF